MKLLPVTRDKLKLVKSLLLKKNRHQEGLFLVEGAKSVLELVSSNFEISFILGTENFFEQLQSKPGNLGFQLFVAKVSDIERSGSLKTNNSAIAVVKIPPNRSLTCKEDEFMLALDEVRDPGNLGTIFRIADWYGITKIVLSENCVDPYGPKTVMASMGSLLRVEIFKTDLSDYLAKSNLQSYGATMRGKDIHSTRIVPPAIIVFGNESNGISKEVSSSVKNTIAIPRYGKAESLNVAMATAIICDNLRRK